VAPRGRESANVELLTVRRRFCLNFSSFFGPTQLAFLPYFLPSLQPDPTSLAFSLLLPLLCFALLCFALLCTHPTNPLSLSLFTFLRPLQLDSTRLDSREPTVVLLRIQGLGFKDPTRWPFFVGERKSGSSRQGFKSLLPCKKHPKLPEISQIWAAFGTIFFFAVCSAFLRVYPFGVNCNNCYGYFFAEFRNLDPKDPDRIKILFLE
jgi:hypothetical protein